MTDSFASVDPSVALSLGMIVAASGFAMGMAIKSKRVEKTAFITYMLQGLTFSVAATVVVGIFWPHFFEFILNQKWFLIIMATMVVIYSGRDIAEHIASSRTLEDHAQKSRQDPAE